MQMHSWGDDQVPESGLVRCSKKARAVGVFPPKLTAARDGVESLSAKMRALFCAAHLVLNTLVDKIGALVEW